MLVLKPKGRGNWEPVYVQISGKHARPLLFQPGQTIELGGISYRICRVHA